MQVIASSRRLSNVHITGRHGGDLDYKRKTYCTIDTRRSPRLRNEELSPDLDPAGVQRPQIRSVHLPLQTASPRAGLEACIKAPDAGPLRLPARPCSSAARGVGDQRACPATGYPETIGVDRDPSSSAGTLISGPTRRASRRPSHTRQTDRQRLHRGVQRRFRAECLNTHGSLTDEACSTSDPTFSRAPSSATNAASKANRDAARSRGIAPVIPHKANKKNNRPSSPALSTRPAPASSEAWTSQAL